MPKHGPTSANIRMRSGTSHQTLQTPKSSQGAAALHLGQAEGDLTEATYRQMEIDADLLDQLILTIRASEPEDTGDLVALVRGVDSHEKLKTSLDQFRPSIRGADKSGEKAVTAPATRKASPTTSRTARTSLAGHQRGRLELAQR